MPWSCWPYQWFNRYRLYRWHFIAYRRWGTGRKHLLQPFRQETTMARVGTSPLYLERNLAGGTGQPRTLRLWGAARKQRETRRRLRWNIRVRFPVWWWWHSIFRTIARGWFSPRKSFPLRKKNSLQQQNCVQLSFLYFPCYESLGLSASFVFYALVDIVILSLIPNCLYRYVCPWSKFNGR